MTEIRCYLFSEHRIRHIDPFSFRRDMRSFFLASARPAWVDVEWLHVRGLDSLTMERLAVKYRLHPLAVEDALSLEQRPKMEKYANGSAADSKAGGGAHSKAGDGDGSGDGKGDNDNYFFIVRAPASTTQRPRFAPMGDRGGSRRRVAWDRVRRSVCPRCTIARTLGGVGALGQVPMVHVVVTKSGRWAPCDAGWPHRSTNAPQHLCSTSPQQLLSPPLAPRPRRLASRKEGATDRPSSPESLTSADCSVF